MRQSSLAKQQENKIMKRKLFTAIAAVAIIAGFSVVNASACYNTGTMMGGGGYGMMSGQGTVNPANQQFLDETKELRVQIATDQAEMNALMVGQNPDSTRVRELAGNIAGNQLALAEKSRSYGYTGGRGNMNHMGGYDMMNGGVDNCWW
jgi:Spy/CpxP family protein refolding chaperone